MSLLSERQEKAFSLFLGDLARQRRVNSGSNGTTPSVSTVYNAISCPPLRVSLAPVVNSAVLPQVPESRCNEVKLSQAGNEAQHDSESKSETAADDSGSEDEGVKRWVVTSPRKPRKITERKRADAAAFSVWLETNQKTLSDDGKPVKDQDKSVAWLLRDFQSPHIIDNPRDYQVELFEKAKQQNSIAVLDTGSGKTLIAALLLRWAIERELEDRVAGKPRRISFFLVDKVALAHQQHGVLETQLDYPAVRFCGDTKHLWNQQTWDETFSNNEIVVCTAEVLYKCLHHSYIQMSQINLLIFDEAHHTKKKHPYAKIIKDFYAEIEGKERIPRIFGMTASPVDAQGDLHRAAAELEGLLHSRIVTAANPADFQTTICTPKKEVVVDYPRLLGPWETQLYQSLKPLLGHNEVFSKALTFSKSAASELGRWCADRFWSLYLGEDALPKFEAKTEQNFLRFSPEGDDADKSIGQVREARKIIEEHQAEDITLQNYEHGLVSGKVSKLIHVLRSKFGCVLSNSRCIIFVEQRWTAMMLADLFEQPGMAIPGLRTGILVGAGSKDTNYKSVSMRDQIMTIGKFRNGDINCLFATSVAEEGLDIPDCNIVIRYDLYNTMIQYIQSRGRARHIASEYIHMVEIGNGEHQRKIVESKYNEATLRRFCEVLPQDRKLSGNDFDMDYFLRKEKGQRKYTVPETGATLTYSSALSCLSSFTAALPCLSDAVLAPSYMVTSAPGGFQCEVLMPEGSPIAGAVGKIHSSKPAAKCSGAFEMCLALIEGKFLNGHLQPIYTKQLPLMRNAHLAISSKKKEEYEMRTKPKMWSDLGVPDQLYATALTLAKPETLGWDSRPLILLTRHPLPPMASFPLFFAKDRSSDAQCMPVSSPIAVDEGTLQKLNSFTLKVFLDVFSKEYEATPSQWPYFVAPSKYGHDFDYSGTIDSQGILDWESLDHVHNTGTASWTGNEPDEFFENKFITDFWDGSRKFFVVGRRHDMKPSDTVPNGVPSPSHRAWNKMEKGERSILNYSVSLWSNARDRFKWREDQPVFEAKLLSTRRNLLDDNLGDKDVQYHTCFLIMEPLRISPLPADVVAMAYALPAIIFKIESCLIAVDACNVLGLAVQPNLALEALTKDSDNSDEHDVEQVNFQGGMGNNYERLEFLGDTFLKMGTTVSIFTLIPDKDEFEYHVERMLLICNKNLFNNALEVKLQEYIRSKSLDRRKWYPEGLTLKRGKRDNSKAAHVLGDKTIADVCEALIGAAYLTGRKDGSFDLAVKALTVMVKDNKRHPMNNWSEYYSSYNKPEWQTAPATTVQLDMANKIATRMGYTFNYPRLLRCAFMHPSYPSRSYEKLPSYQRLEFLGDALLDMTCVEFLFRRYPGADPQWLTEHKMAMVSNQFLGCLSVSLGFNKMLVSFSSAVQNEIFAYVTEIAAALEEAEDEAERAGKDRSDYARNYWVRCSNPPKCLPDVVESYIGAIFVDSGYDFSVVQNFFDAYVLPYFADMRQYDSFARNHPVTRLAQLLQDKFHCNDWRILVQELAANATDGSDKSKDADQRALFDLATGTKRVVGGVRVHGQTLAHGLASNGRQAKTIAARKALVELNDLDLAKFRERFGCECRLPGGENGTEEADETVHGSAI